MRRLLFFLLTLATFSSLSSQTLRKAIVKKFDNGKTEIMNYYKGEKIPDNLAKQERYNIDGKVVVEKNFKNKLLHGPYKEYKEFDETLKMELNYAEGKLDGEQKYFFSDGRVKLLLNYIGGQLDGPQQEFFFKNDTLASVHNYSGGILHGVQTRWDKDINKVYQVNFVAGKPDGIQRFWKSGKMTEERWVQGQLEEVVDEYTASQPKHVRVYSFVNEGDSLEIKWGKKVERETQYFQSGSISGMLEPGDPPSITLYHPNGKTMAEGKGTFEKMQGPWVYMHQNGKKMKEGEYKDGMQVGVWRTWDEKERLVSEEVMNTDGSKRESWKVMGYHWNDKKSYEGQLTNDGWKTGRWKYWFETGNKNKEEEWKDECPGNERPVLTEYKEWTPAGKVLLKGNERQMVEHAYYDTGELKSLTTLLYVHRDPCSVDQPEKYIDGRWERKINVSEDYYKKVTKEEFIFTESGDTLTHEVYDNEGKRHGYQIGWYADGKKKYEYHYLHGRVQGTVKEWYPTGLPLVDLKYRSAVGGPAKLVEGTFYNEKGKDYYYNDAEDGGKKKKAVIEVESVMFLPKYMAAHPNE